MDREVMVKSKDGTGLYLKVKDVEHPKASVVFSHGLCEHQGKYQWLAEVLGEHGFRGYFFDHRGHGRSEGRRAYYQDCVQILEDIRAVMDYAAGECEGLPVYLIGHSMGGYGAAYFATAYPERAAGIVLCGALTRYHTPCAGKLPIPAPAETIYPNLYEDGSYKASDIEEALREDPYLGREITVGLLNSIYDGIQWMKLHGREFTAPVLILHGDRDGLVSPRDSMDLYEEIASADKTLSLYQGFRHELLNGVSKEKVAADILRWMEERIV